jgi:quercetin dioxygenase-like cupin family protein
MDVKPVGSRPTAAGPGDYFQGKVWIDHIVDASIPSAAKSVMLTFEPGARTAWHTHPLGQTIHVLSGLGQAQRWGGEVITIRPGDTVWFPPGEKHWHGAALQNTMVHLAIQEAKEGVTVEWLEHVETA